MRDSSSCYGAIRKAVMNSVLKVAILLKGIFLPGSSSSHVCFVLCSILVDYLCHKETDKYKPDRVAVLVADPCRGN